MCRLMWENPNMDSHRLEAVKFFFAEIEIGNSKFFEFGDSCTTL